MKSPRAASIRLTCCCATAFALIAALLLPSIAFNQENKDGSMAGKLEPFIQEVFALDLSPGMGVAVVRGNEVVYANGFGFADIKTQRRVTPETIFYIASTTKSFTAFAAALLHQRGKLNLDAPVSRYLPALRLQSPLSADSISMRDLLTHTHGIDNDGPVVFRTAFSGEHTNKQLIELLSAHKPASTGRAFSYGNIGYNIAGLAMDAALGASWKEVLQKEIFKPLGMKSTTAYMSKADHNRLALPYIAEEKGYRPHYAKSDANMHAAGGHVTTVLDLARWLIVHLNAGRIDGKQVFPAEVVAETHRQQADQDRNFGNYHRYGWGLGWDLGTFEGDTLIHRFGSFPGFRSHVSFMPRHKIGVVVLVNESFLGSRLADMVASCIYDRLLEKTGVEEKHRNLLAQFKEESAKGRARIAEDRAKRAARPQQLPHPLAAYTGAYENAEYGRMDWRVVDGKLEASMGLLHSSVEVYDAEKNQLRVELTGRGEVIEFSLHGDRAEAITYDELRFVRAGE